MRTKNTKTTCGKKKRNSEIKNSKNKQNKKERKKERKDSESQCPDPEFPVAESSVIPKEPAKSQQYDLWEGIKRKIESI